MIKIKPGLSLDEDFLILRDGNLGFLNRETDREG